MEKKHRTPIKEWDIDQRPREKLVALGASSLTNEELLGILIGSGTVELSAVGLGRQLLDSVGGNLNRLGGCDVPSLMKMKGLGLARAVSIAAALELGRRRKAEEVEVREVIDGSRDVADLFRPLLGDLPHEEVWVLLLTSSKRIIERYRLSQGGIAATILDTRLIMRRALERMATAIILVHNHPSGEATPSEMDIANTRKVKAAASLFDIRLLDHVIVTYSDYFSFTENGVMV